ncbi:tetratricopeptide repeat protein [Acidicapsa ligni]|uniref:tetratricopeptide repeat protein n=1 Tax=Acidicapsa ligni TaxID=542300 RepID=UPI0021E01904|nr:tetratricopeptide repeat protein [Acidicapsa ligni]
MSEVQHLVDRGQLDEALKATDALAQQHPAAKGVDRLRGKIFYLKTNLEEADKAFAAALHDDPSDRESLELRGVTLLRMGKTAAALPLLEQSHANLSNLNINGTYVLALCYLKEHRYDDARLSFAGFYGMDVESSSSYLLLARMLLREQNSTAAQEMAKKALTINPKIPEAHFLLGQIYFSVGNLDQALDEFQHETKINPMYGPAYDRLGDTLLQKNQFEKAQDALNRAILLEPDMTGPYILLGQVLLKRDNPATAAIYLKRAVQMDPGNQMSHFFLGQAYRDMGKKPEAMIEFKASEKITAASRK